MEERIKLWHERFANAAEMLPPKYAVTVVRVIAGILSGCFLLSFLFHKSLATLAIVLFLIAVIWYVLVKNHVSEEAPQIAAEKWLKADLYLASACVGLVPYCAAARLFGGVTSSITMLGVMGLAMTLALVLVFMTSETGKKAWDFLNKDFAATANNGEKTLKPGDVVLCDNKELKEAHAKDPREILPCKDRFLHMLILGPTGGGKTSQVILPMCFQDIHNTEAGVTVLEPKGDLAREVAMMAEEMGRPYIYFDPSVDNCPFFNPLIGDETDVIENAVTTFLSLNPDSPQYFKDLSEQLVRNTLKVLKRLDKAKGIDGYYSTFIWMSRVLQNSGGQGKDLVQKFANIRSATEDEAKENADIASWFLNEYFAERSKVYENSSGIRSQVSKVIANRYLRHVLNPDVEKGEYNQIDFDKHLAEGGVICISTAQGLMRDLGKFLGYFLILQFKSAVFRRPGNEDTRRAHFLYIDEFQQYSTPGFSEMLTQGRSYRVACHLATQARAQMAMGGGNDGKNFVNLVSTNARNVVIFPGGSSDDAEYYSKQFGEYEREDVSYSHSQKSFNLLTGGLSSLGHPTDSTRVAYKKEAIFSASDLIYRPFGEIVYCIIKNNSIQKPQVGVIKWLDKDYDKKLKQMIDDMIVVHEIHPSAETITQEPTPEQKGEISWEDPAPEEQVIFTSQEPETQEDDISAAETAAMFDDPMPLDEEDLAIDAPSNKDSASSFDHFDMGDIGNDDMI